MRKVIFVLLSLNSLSYSQYNSELKLKDAINAALKNNISILETEQDLIIAKQKVRQARLMFLPQIYFTGDIIKGNIEMPSIIGMEQDYRYINDYYNDKYVYGMRAIMMQPLYTGGRLSGNLQLSKAEYNREKLKNELAKIDTIYKIKKIFYTMVFYHNLLEELNELYKKLKENFFNEKAERTLADIIKMEIEIKNEISELKNKYLTLKSELLMEMGSPTGFDFEIKEKLKPFDSFKIDLNKCIITAMEKRPELKSELYQVQIDNISANIASLRKYPNLYLGLSYDVFSRNYSSLKSPSFKNENFIAYLSVQYPFPYDLWININKRKAEQRNTELRKIRLEENIKLNITKAYRQYLLYTEKMNEYLEKKEYIENVFKTSLNTNNDENKIKTFKLFYEFKKDFLTATYMQINSLIELEKEQAEEIIK